MSVKTKKPKPQPTYRFEKDIVTEGKYRTYDQSTGKYTLKEVSANDLKEVVDTFKELSSRGFKVPAPWKHDFSITTFIEGDSGILQDSTKNAGFWDKLYLRDNEEGKKVLVGEIEAPGDRNDPDSPAGRIGNSVKDTSIYLRRSYQLTDEEGKEFKNVPMHIALVTHPIELKQDNFKELNVDDYSIAMSELVSDSDFSELSRLLKEVSGIYLPASTTPETLVGNLTIALTQKALSDANEDEDGKDGVPNKTFEMEPIIMSKLNKEQVEALVAANVINPSTKKPFTLDDLKTEETPEPKVDTKTELVMSAMQNAMQDDRRKGLRSRINSLVESGRTPKEFADVHLYPKADHYKLQFDGTNIAIPEIETVIMSLEALPARKDVQQKATDLGGISAEYLNDGSNDLSDTDSDKLVDMMMGSMDEFSL